MGLQPKYIEENNVSVEDLFIQNIKFFGIKKAISISKYLECLITQVEVKNQEQIVAGALKVSNEIIYFEVEFLKYSDNSLVLIDIREIEVNDYLDYMNAGYYLTYEESNQTL
jgi:hypothetical protein